MNTTKPLVKGFFDERTFSVQYVVADPDTKTCAIVDPVLDFNEKSGATATKNADAILSYVNEQGYEVEWILDTHPHGDHFSAAQYLKEKTGAPTAIGEKVVKVQKLWKGIYNWPDLPADGSQWDMLLAEGETLKVGNIPARVLFSPGHTLASITCVIGDAAFVHDTLHAGFGNRKGRFPWRQRVAALHVDHKDPVAARRDSHLHRPRLSARRPKAALGVHGRRAEGKEQAHVDVQDGS